MDMISELGELALASRLKRLSDRMMRDASQVYRKLGVEFEARWFSILYTLGQNSPMAITTLAQSLRLTHPAVNQLAAEMLKKGLILSKKSKEDERKRLLRISAKGKKMVATLSPVWEEIRLATKECIQTSGHTLIDALESMEEELDKEEIFHRVWNRIKKQRTGKVEIVSYRPAWKKRFKELNMEWLKKYFIVENEDERLLSDPQGTILKPGGFILFARMNRELVGTCALVRHSEEAYELTKMAVTEKAQGFGIGTSLASAAVDKARASGAMALFLQTHQMLKGANAIYKRLGFRKINKSPLYPERYRRATYVMRLKLIES